MNWEREKQVLEKAIRAAGDAVCKIYNSDFETTYKGKDNPLTAADLEANRILQEILLEEFPDDGWLSEETVDSDARLSKSRVWIVDPIDGTREFVKKIPDFVISAALSADHSPVLGMVYNPIKEELFTAVKDQGTTLNGERIATKEYDPQKIKLIISRSEYERGEFKQFEDIFHELEPTGSVAYKLALIASGHADGTFSLTPRSEWDIAAGVLILQEVGGLTTDKNGDSINFNQSDYKVKGIIAGSKEAHVKISEIICQSKDS